MPSSLHSLSQIQKFIPKKWKQLPRQSTPIISKDSIVGDSTHSNESMIETLVISLRDSSKLGHLLKAFRTFSIIKHQVSNSASISGSTDPILHSLSALLLCCTNLKSLHPGKQLHAHIISSGCEKNPILVPKLVKFYSDFGFLNDAHFLTESSGVLNPLPWNVLISSYVRVGLCKEAIFSYNQMVKLGIAADHFTYPSVIKACSEELDLSFGKEVHKSIDSSGLEWNLFVYNALVSMYGKCGQVIVARKLFDEMPERDVVSWNAMISAYALTGMLSEASELLVSMRAECEELDYVPWNTVAGEYLKKGEYKEALRRVSKMRASGIRLDFVSVIIALAACSHIGVLKLGKEVHGVSIRNHYDEMINVKNALITLYSRCEDLTRAYILFCSVEQKTVISWNSIISGFALWDKSEESSILFREMLKSGLKPNFVTIASILPLCARVANLKHGKEFHCYITRHEEFKYHLLLWNSLVDMYARSGKIESARRLFDSLSKRDEVTYTSLIAGYKGEGRVAVSLFEEMIKFGIKPDHLTMVAVLSACSHSGLLSKGDQLFKNMQTLYNLKPQMEHYACMVDLYGRFGLIKKAAAILRNMPCQPTPGMWATLIGACRIHGDTDIGEWAAEKLLEMRPNNPGYYVLISNMYAAAESWKKLAEVRTFMRDMGVRKDPGCAWVDAGASGYSPFLAGDATNIQTSEMLTALTKQSKEVGYVTSEDSSSEDQVLEA